MRGARRVHLWCQQIKRNTDDPRTAQKRAGAGYGREIEQMTLLDRIDSLQRRADALKGRPGYQVALARLRDAKLAALAGGE